MPQAQSPETVSRRMAAVPSRDTGPERVVRALVHSLGRRFRVRNRDLPGSPDIANRSARWAIFVHGCFWHHHVGCPRASRPKSNRHYWREKFQRNRRRDASALRSLSSQGFNVLVLWQCELESEQETVKRLRSFFSRMRFVRSRPE
jgi:DNA mismatch endonuclease (patch repair protein)